MKTKQFKGLIIFSILFFLLIIVYLFSNIYKKGINEKVVSPLTFFDLQQYPGAKLVEENLTPDENGASRVTLSIKTSIPQVSQWYLNNITKSEWKLDIPPSDVNNTSVQYIRLSKGEMFLGISLSAEGEITQITLEQFPSPKSDVGEQSEKQ